MTRSDREHLHVLSICHYALGGLCFFGGGFAIIYLAIGIASFMLVFYWGLAAVLVLAGRCISQRRWHTFCLIVAGAACLLQPLGMVLGIFTFIVLLRPGVREGFGAVWVEDPEHDAYYSE